jgi:hypothetical protein
LFVRIALLILKENSYELFFSIEGAGHGFVDQCLDYGPGQMLTDHHPQFNQVGFHFYTMESAMAYRRDHLPRDIFEPAPNIQRMVDEMKLYNYFFISFRAKNYNEAIRRIDDILMHTLGIRKIRILFYHSKGRSQAFYCRINSEVRIFAEILQGHLKNMMPTLSVRDLVLPFEISKALMTSTFHGCFKKY